MIERRLGLKASPRIHAHDIVHVWVHVVVIIVIVVVIIIIVVVIVVDRWYDVDDCVQQSHRKWKEGQLGIRVSFLKVELIIIEQKMWIECKPSTNAIIAMMIKA